jgi:hypothetical protein
VNRWEILFYEGFKWNKKINRSIDRTWIGGNRICAVFALREMSEARLSIYGPPVEDPSTKQTSFRIFWIFCLFCHSRARVKDVHAYWKLNSQGSVSRSSSTYKDPVDKNSTLARVIMRAISLRVQCVWSIVSRAREQHKEKIKPLESLYVW